MGKSGGVRLVPGLDIRAGQTIAGKYRVDELLGSGAAGVVLSAQNIWLRDSVTLKLLASYTDGQEEILQKRLDKARLAARLSSEHVARIVEIGATADGIPYVATESLAGKTLAVELEERGRLGVREAVRWVLQACEGLAEAHAIGLVHGDLKPQNLFLADPPDGDARSERILKILDFGTTSPLDAIGDQSASAFFCSPAFLAPEQIRASGPIDARADVWALGVLLYNAISGTLPFTADTVSGVIVAVVYDVPGLLVNAPYELARLVHRCLDKDPAKRPQDVMELAAALAPFAGAGGAGLSDRVRAMLESQPRPPPPRSWLAAIVDAYASMSVAPVSLPTAEKPEHPSADAKRPTGPSLRVLAARHLRRLRTRRAQKATLAMLGVTATVFFGTTLSGPARDPREQAQEQAPPPAPLPPLATVATADAGMPDAK